MNLNHLKYFLVLAKTEHYAKASQQLFVSQPTLSYAVNALEQELGVALFDKNGRNVQLTEEGRLFATHIERALEEIEKAKESVGPESVIPEETISVLLTRQWYLQPQINRIKSERKYRNLHFQISQAHSFEVYSNLMNEKCDIGFSSIPFNDSNVNCIEMRDYDLMLVVPESHKWAKRTSFDLRELGNEPVVMKEANTELGKKIQSNVYGSRSYAKCYQYMQNSSLIGRNHFRWYGCWNLSVLPLYQKASVGFYTNFIS